jgi:hypothetical protein
LEPDLLGEHLVATELAGFGEVIAGVLQRDDPVALAQPLDVYARAVVAYPALSVAVGSVLSSSLETPVPGGDRAGRDSHQSGPDVGHHNRG